jgi:MFS family permease
VCVGGRRAGRRRHGSARCHDRHVAGPSIHDDLGGGASTLQWLSASYTLAFAVVLIAGARLGDIFGRRRLFLVGSAGFTLFSAASAAAPTIGVLIGFRALQGAFGALMIPQGFGLMKQASTMRPRWIRHWVCSVRQRVCRCSARRSSPAR